MSRLSLLKPFLRSPHRSRHVVCSVWLLVLGLVIVAAPVAAGTPECADQARGEGYSIMDILDANVPSDVRLVNAESLKRRAQLPGCEEDRYVLGSLYQHGTDLPGNPLAKDTALARQLLEGYGLEGYPVAFGQLAELALAEENAVEAMQWTQVYLYLVTHFQVSLGPERSGYNADLLRRAEKAWEESRDKGDTPIESALIAYFRRHPGLGQRVARNYLAARENIAALSSEAGLGEVGLRVKHSHKGGMANLRIKPGYAIYLLEVQPSGQVSRIAVQTFGPTPTHAKKLRALVEAWEYYPHRGHKPEVVRVPVLLGYSGPRFKTKK